jgi:hypothetical protein
VGGAPFLTGLFPAASTLGGVNQDRAQAYRRVTNRIEDLAATKLHADEQQLIRDAADTLIFSESLTTDDAAVDALRAVYGLVDRLIESGRMLPETADALVADVEACGPVISIARAA